MSDTIWLSSWLRRIHDVVWSSTETSIRCKKTQENAGRNDCHGNGACLVLQEAGIEECDLLIAVTSGDEVNILCCMMARQAGVQADDCPREKSEYDEQLMMLNEDLGFAMTINPKERQRWRCTDFCSCHRFERDSFANGKAELVEIKVMEKGRCAG